MVVCLCLSLASELTNPTGRKPHLSTLKMISTPQVSRNRRRYGVDYIEKYVLGITETITYKLKGGNSVVVDLITHAQDLMADGDVNNARQILNIAKHILDEIANGKLVGTVKRK